VQKHKSPIKILVMHKGRWVDIENLSQENEGGKPQKEWPQTRTVLCHRHAITPSNVPQNKEKRRRNKLKYKNGVYMYARGG
jgi:hypothetical protein